MYSTALAKSHETLIKKMFMLLYSSPFDDFSHLGLPHNLIINAFSFLPAVGFSMMSECYLMISEYSYSWCVVSVFVTSLRCLRLSISLVL